MYPLMEVFNLGCIQRWISKDGDIQRSWYQMMDTSNDEGIRRWRYPMMMVSDQRLKRNEKIQKSQP